MAGRISTALILAGHGSHISPQTAGLVWAQVDALRGMGVADEVTAAFWKEVPSFHTVLNTITATDITVVPLFTAQGYFTQTVIPGEMGLSAPLTLRDGRTIRYTRTLSEHPYLSHIVRQRVQMAVAEIGARPDQTAIAVIGHGTRRSPESRKATEAQAEQIRKLGIFPEVEAVYLDDSPEIGEIYNLTDAPTLIAVPYFLALGSHTTQDLPDRLGLERGQTHGTVSGRQVHYTKPVGVEESLREVILELARDAGMPPPHAPKTSVWEGFPAAGRDELIDVVNNAGGLLFGELLLTPTEVRPRSGQTEEVLDTPADLRERVREEVMFRPLATSTDLPGGWHVPISDPRMIHAVVETIYPGAVADWASQRRGSLAVIPLKVLAERQTGMYQSVMRLSAAGRAAVVKRVCDNCVRYPLWADKKAFPTEPGAIPCPEACNSWLTEALGDLSKVTEETDVRKPTASAKTPTASKTKSPRKRKPASKRR